MTQRIRYFAQSLDPVNPNDRWMGTFLAFDDEDLWWQIDEAEVSPYTCMIVKMPKANDMTLGQWKRFKPGSSYHPVLEDAPPGWIVENLTRLLTA